MTPFDIKTKQTTPSFAFPNHLKCNRVYLFVTRNRVGGVAQIRPKKRSAESYLNKTKSVSSPLAKQPSRAHTRFNIHTPLFHMHGGAASKHRQGLLRAAACAMRGPLPRRLTPTPASQLVSFSAPGKKVPTTHIKSAFSRIRSGRAGIFAHVVAVNNC